MAPVDQVGAIPLEPDTPVASAAEWLVVSFEHAGVPGFAAETWGGWSERVNAAALECARGRLVSDRARLERARVPQEHAAVPLVPFEHAAVPLVPFEHAGVPLVPKDRAIVPSSYRQVLNARFRRGPGSLPGWPPEAAGRAQAGRSTVWDPFDVA